MFFGGGNGNQIARESGDGGLGGSKDEGTGEVKRGSEQLVAVSTGGIYGLGAGTQEEQSGQEENNGEAIHVVLTKLK